MTVSAAWLTEKAKGYGEDAAKMRRLPGRMGGFTGEQWAVIYRAVSDELMKCAREAPVDAE